MVSEIQVGDFTFAGVAKVRVSSSWETLTDTAQITFPRKVKWEGRNLASGADPLLKRLDPVTVSLGYEDAATVFQGYIRDIGADTPVTVLAEDAMYLLKQQEVGGSWKQATLSEVLGAICPIQFKVLREIELGPLRFDKVNAAEALAKLKEKYLTWFWVRKGKLYAGSTIDPDQSATYKFDFNWNIISHELEYRMAEDVRLKLRGIITNRDNTTTTVEVGDSDGDMRTFNYYNRSAKDVKADLESRIEELKYTGFRGSFVTFGAPRVQHGDKIHLVDVRYPDREMTVYAKHIETTFGPDGYRQRITVEGKAG